MVPKELNQNESILDATNADELERHNGRAVLKTQATGSHALGAQAIGALAIGALAIGTVALWRLAIGQLFIRKSKMVMLEIDELIIKRLRVGELTVTENLALPEAGMGKK